MNLLSLSLSLSLTPDQSVNSPSSLCALSITTWSCVISLWIYGMHVIIFPFIALHCYLCPSCPESFSGTGTAGHPLIRKSALSFTAPLVCTPKCHGQETETQILPVVCHQYMNGWMLTCVVKHSDWSLRLEKHYTNAIQLPFTSAFFFKEPSLWIQGQGVVFLQQKFDFINKVL